MKNGTNRACPGLQFGEFNAIDYFVLPFYWFINTHKYIHHFSNSQTEKWNKQSQPITEFLKLVNFIFHSRVDRIEYK